MVLRRTSAGILPNQLVKHIGSYARDIHHCPATVKYSSWITTPPTEDYACGLYVPFSPIHFEPLLLYTLYLLDATCALMKNHRSEYFIVREQV